MGVVTLNIEGLSASYLDKKKDWNVVFPCDGKHHRVNFRYRKSNGEESEPVSLEKRNIRITIDGKRVDGKQEESFRKVLNLTSDKLHKEGVRFSKKPTKDKSTMIVQNAIFYTAEFRIRENFVCSPHGECTRVEDEIASIIAAEIQLEDNKKARMQVDGLNGFPLDFEDGDLLLFDNDCCYCTFSNDFAYYQEIFENSSDPRIKFEFYSKPIPRRSSDQRFTKITLLGGPPPAFCDGVRIEKADDL